MATTATVDKEWAKYISSVYSDDISDISDTEEFKD